jgi:hypothetical protein
VLQPHHAARHEQGSDKQHRNPAQKVVMSWSDLGDERAEKQPHEQAADVRRVIGASNDCSKEEVVSDKYHYASQRSAECGARQRKLAQIKRCDQSPGNPENCARRADAKDDGIPDQAREARR